MHNHEKDNSLYTTINIIKVTFSHSDCPSKLNLTQIYQYLITMMYMYMYNYMYPKNITMYHYIKIKTCLSLILHITSYPILHAMQMLCRKHINIDIYIN